MAGWLQSHTAAGLRADRRPRCKSVESVSSKASRLIPPPNRRPLARRDDRAQHRFAWPAIDLQSGLLLIRSERRAGLHAGLAVKLVLVEPDARQMTLHGF